jgi:glycosyltransferase involved in cell wall biosynthesis
MLQITSKSDTSQRVFMFVPNGVVGDSRVIKTATSLRNLGFELKLAGLHSGPEAQKHIVVEGVEATLINNAGLSLRFDRWELLDCVRSIAVRLLRLFRSFAPDILYTHDFMGLDAGGVLLSRTPPDRPISWFHDVHEYVAGYTGIIPDERLSYGLDVERRFLKLPNKLIFVNETIRDLLCREHSINPDECLVLHNLPRAQKHSVRRPLRTCLSLAQDIPLGVYIGRATQARGLDDLIPVLTNLPTLHVALLSETHLPYLDTLRDKARHEGVEQRLHILGYVPDTEIAATIKDANFGLCPLTRYGNSDLAIASKLYEYIHAGIPVIASDASMQSDFIRAQGTGWIYRSERPHELAEIIRKLLQGAISCTADWRQLRNTFTWERQFAPVADALLSAHRSPPLAHSSVPSRYNANNNPTHYSFLLEQQAASKLATQRDWDTAILAYARNLEIYPRDLGSLRGLAIISESEAVPTLARLRAAQGLSSRTHTFVRSAGLTHDLYDFRAFLSEMRRAAMVGKLASVSSVRPVNSNAKPEATPAKPIRRLCLVTCVWKRPALTSLVFRHYRHLAKSMQGIDITIVAAGSEGTQSRDLCEANGVHYVESPNTPLSFKWDLALHEARLFEPDGIIIVGSDDLLDENLFRFYIRCLEDGDMFVGLLDAYFIELASEQMIYWRGFGDLAGQPERVNETLGMGRCLSRRLLEQLNYSLWSGRACNRGLDRLARARLAEIGHQPILRRDAVNLAADERQGRYGQLGVRLADTGGMAVDLKSDGTFITPFSKLMTSPAAYLHVSEPWALLGKHFPVFVIDELRSLAEEKTDRKAAA